MFFGVCGFLGGVFFVGFFFGWGWGWGVGGGVASALKRSPAKRLCNRTPTLTRDGREKDSPSALSTVSAMTEGNAWCRLTSEKEAAKPAWQ